MIGTRASTLMPRVLGIWVVILAICTQSACAGEGAQFAEAYNELVRMIWSRQDAIGSTHATFPLKDPNNPATGVSSAEVGNLQLTTRVLMNRFVSNPPYTAGPWTIDQAVAMQAFPILAQTENTSFLLIPAAYTVSGNEVRSDTFSGNGTLPVLFEQLEDIHRILSKMRHTLTVGAWSAEGQPSRRIGATSSGPWLQVTTAAGKAFHDAAVLNYSGTPCFFSNGVRAYPGTGPDRFALAVANGNYCVVTGLPNFPNQIHFYGYARIFPLSTSGQPKTSEKWDNYGVNGVAQNRWTEWGQSAGDGSGRAVSPFLGPKAVQVDSVSEWCDEPGDPAPLFALSTHTVRGFDVSAHAVIVEWTGLYTPKELKRVNVQDQQDDGIAYLGCDCADCAPGADPGWQDIQSNPSCRFPLGISSGLQNGGLRIQAYITEFQTAGQVQQMLNLDTCMLLRLDGVGGWGFSYVRRPNGVDLLFCLKGARAGEAINGRTNAKIKNNNGIYELHFGGKNNVVHRYGGGSNSGVPLPGAGTVDQVRMTTKGGHEVSVTRGVVSLGPETTITWPGLVIVKDRTSPLLTKSVRSPIYAQANPTYGANGIASAVHYYDSSSTPLTHNNITSGSRIFTITDVAGVVQDKLRIHAETTTVWMVERFGPLPTVAQREVVRVEETADELTHVRHTVFLNPGANDAQSNANETVLARFAWGLEVAQDVRGSDANNPEITRYTYETNAAATNAYGRLVLVEQPDGGWTRFAYDAAGRETERIEPFGDVTPTDSVSRCRAEYSVYASNPVLAGLNFPTNDVSRFNDNRPRLEIEHVLGHEVARTYHAYLADRTVSKRCRTPGAAYDAIDNVPTERQVFTNGAFSGFASVDTDPDGRFTRYTYTYSAPLQRLTTTRETGAGSALAITNGTRSITVLGADNRVVSERTVDIASGLTLTDMVYTRDKFGRATNTVDLRHGTTNTAIYGCCGLERSVDDEGIETWQDYTQLKQVFATTRAGVTSYRKYDSWGHAARTWEATANTSLPEATSWYDAAGRMIASTNTLGAGTSYLHTNTTAGGRMETVVGADGSTSTETFFRDGRPLAITGTAATPACYAYGAGPGETWTIEYRGSNTQATEWVKTVADMLGNVTRVVYPDGYTVTHGYDEAGRQVRRSDGFVTELTAYSVAGDVVRHAVDMNGNGVIDLAGPDRVTETVNRVVRVAGVDVSETESRVFAVEGSTNATVASISRGGLNGTQSWSVVWGRTNYAGVARNKLLATRTETQLSADGMRAVTVYSNGLMVTESALAADGSLTQLRRHTYDPFGRPATETELAANGETRTTRTDYDSSGQVTNVTEAAGSLTRSTRFVYDVMGRRVRTILPDGGAVDVSYGAGGEVLQQSGARTYPMRYGYDTQGRLTSLSTYRQGLTGLADTTTWQHDPQRGWLVAKYFADGSHVSYSNQLNGALRSRRWARGVETTYAYDSVGTTTNITYSDGTPPVSFRVDRLGRAMEIRDAIGTHQRTYTFDNAPLTETQPQSPGLILARDYDTLGRPTNTAIRLNTSEKSHTSYAYDQAGRLRTVSDGTQFAAYTYGADGATVTNVALGAWGVVANRFDGLGRLLETKTRSGPTTLHRSAYTYNTADQRTRQDLSDGSYWTYTYDVLGQLTSGKKIFADSIPVGGAQFVYAYDTIGNRTTARNFRGQGTQTSTYAANELNQYMERTVPGEIWVSGEARTDTIVTVQSAADTVPIPASRHGAAFWEAVPVNNTTGVAIETNLAVIARLKTVTGGVTTGLIRAESRATMLPQTPETFTHDADGNLTADGLWRYLWDGENRLIVMESGAGVPPAQKRRLTFTYDHQGRRVSKIVSTWTNSLWSPATTTTFIYDGWLLISESVTRPPPLAPSESSFLWGLDISGTRQGAGGVGGLISSAQPTPLAPSYSVFDGNGDVAALATPTGTQTAQYEYGPFGEPLRTSGASTPFRFSTKYTDPETALVMYPARPYTPTLGRFLTRDPIAESGGVNLHAYVNNAPPNAVDALGLALYAFDGTANVPSDQTNIRITHDSGYSKFSTYAGGIGNDEEYSILTRLVRKGTGWGLTAKKGKMLNDLAKRIALGDLDVDVIGFSRGAVTAVAFAAAIEKAKEEGIAPYCQVHSIRFLGLYDPVPGPTIEDSTVISPIVESTSIAYSLDERRSSFAASLYSGRGITSRAFRGGHSDVGGGYKERGLANISLEWMIARGRGAGAPFAIPSTPGGVFTDQMIRHQETKWFYAYDNREFPSGAGIPQHRSVSRLVDKRNDGRTSPFRGIDLGARTYYWDYVAPGRDQYQIGQNNF